MIPTTKKPKIPNVTHNGPRGGTFVLKHDPVTKQYKKCYVRPPRAPAPLAPVTAGETFDLTE